MWGMSAVRLVAASNLFAALTALSAGTPPPSPTGAFVYRGTASGAESLSTTGVVSWTTRSVEATVTPLAGAAGSMGLVLHHQDDSNHYLFLFSTNSTAFMIYKKVAGGYTLLSSVPATVNLGEEHAMRAEAVGGTLALYWDDVLRVSVADSTYSSGRVGTRVWNMTADFDDVHAKDGGGATLLFDDFEDGDASGWNAGSGWSVAGSGGATMPTPVFDTSFEGGNASVSFVDTVSWTVYVTPELKGSSPYRGWFYFKMSNLSSEQPTNFVFQSAAFFRRPAYSYDDEHWTEFPPAVGGTYSLTLTGDPVWIAHSIPYLTTHQDELIADLEGPLARVRTLATSEGGRPVEVLEITAPGPARGKCGVWLVARQHAWEASGSWIADGLARWLVSPDPQALSLLLRARFHIVPIMDVDNVVLGGSGKDQQPIDINRDWRATPHWNAVSAAIGAIGAYAEANPYDVFIDSHCPGSSTTFLAVQPQSMVSAAYWERFQSFRQALISTASTAANPYTGSVSQWGPSYHPLWNQMSFWHQYDHHPELRLSLTLETRTSTKQGYRELSAGLGRALEMFLPCKPRLPAARRSRSAPEEVR